MKISTRGQYGTRALLDIALNQNEGPVPLKAIAAREQISLYYLERIIASLVKAGFLRSTRGPNGGVSLGKLPQEIRLSELIEALEGSLAPVECVDDPSACSRTDICVTCDIWADVKRAIDGVLESVTLQNLVERHHEKQGQAHDPASSFGSGEAVSASRSSSPSGTGSTSMRLPRLASAAMAAKR